MPVRRIGRRVPRELITHPEDAYEEGYEDGYSDCLRESRPRPRRSPARKRSPPKKARKLTAWNRYVKQKKNHIKMRDGKLNLKKMAVQFRKKKRR